MITRITAAVSPFRQLAAVRASSLPRIALARPLSLLPLTSAVPSAHEAIMAASSSSRMVARSFHASSSVCAPKGKKSGGGKGGGGGDSEEGAAPVVLPDLKRLDAGMEDKISRMSEEFSKIRGGRVSPDMFKSLVVDVHGAKIPLQEAGQVTLATPTKLSVTTYDASAATPGEKCSDWSWRAILYVLFFNSSCCLLILPITLQ